MTVLVAIVALVVGKNFKVQGPAKWLTICALGLLGGATILAVISNLMRSYKVPAESTFESILGDRWTDSAVTARLSVAWLDLDTLLSLRAVNNRKSWWLDRALWLQLAGIIAIVAAAIAQVWVSV